MSCPTRVTHFVWSPLVGLVARFNFNFQFNPLESFPNGQSILNNFFRRFFFVFRQKEIILPGAGRAITCHVCVCVYVCGRLTREKSASVTTWLETSLAEKPFYLYLQSNQPTSLGDSHLPFCFPFCH